MRLRRRDAIACREAVALMSDYLDGALAAGDRRRLELHLAGCPHCTEYLAQLRVTLELAARVPAPAPDAETTQALAQLYRAWRKE